MEVEQRNTWKFRLRVTTKLTPIRNGAFDFLILSHTVLRHLEADYHLLGLL